MGILHRVLHCGPGSGGVSAASKTGADRAGAQIVRIGAQGNFTYTGTQLPQGHTGTHSLYLPHKRGDIVDVLLLCADLSQHIQGEGYHRGLSPVIELHPRHQHTLDFQPLEGLCAEVPPIHGVYVDARIHKGGSGAVGLRLGVAVHKAAAVGGHCHIQGQRRILRHRPPLADDVVNDLPAGGLLVIQTGILGVKLLGGVVVDGQVYSPLQPDQGVFREQAPGRHIHRHHGLRGIALRGQQPLHIGAVDLRQLGVGQHPRILSLLPQGDAQSGRTAYRVPIRAHMGQDQKTFPLQQPFCSLFKGQPAHSCSP